MRSMEIWSLRRAARAGWWYEAGIRLAGSMGSESGQGTVLEEGYVMDASWEECRVGEML